VKRTRIAAALSGVLSTMIAVTACDRVLDGATLSEDFRRAMLEEWASPGATFLGRYGGGPVVAAEEAEPDVWRVVYPLESGDTVRATLRFTGVDAYRIFPDEDFARLVDRRARERDRRSGLVVEAWRLIQSGENDAIGRMGIEVRRPEASGTQRMTLYALRRSGEEPTWEFLAERRSLTNAFEGIDNLYETMMRSDDRVMDCARGTDPMSDRPRFLVCTEEILAEEYGPEEENGG